MLCVIAKIDPKSKARFLKLQEKIEKLGISVKALHGHITLVSYIGEDEAAFIASCKEILSNCKVFPVCYDKIEVCFGYPYDRSGIYTKLPIPQRFQCDQMQSFADILNGCSDGMAATIQDGCRIQHALDVIIRSAEEEKWLPCD